MGPCLGNMGVDTPVECFFWLQMLHNLGRACQCTVIVNLPCARLPFSWLFTAECITLALVMKVEVHSLALCSKVIVHNTSTIKKSNKHHLCLAHSWVVEIIVVYFWGHNHTSLFHHHLQCF